jgi:hypothetical protein
VHPLQRDQRERGHEDDDRDDVHRGLSLPSPSSREPR